MDRLDGQLVFLIITFLVWLVTAMAERARKRREAAQRAGKVAAERARRRAESPDGETARGEVGPAPTPDPWGRPEWDEASLPDEEDQADLEPLAPPPGTSLPSEAPAEAGGVDLHPVLPTDVAGDALPPAPRPPPAPAPALPRARRAHERLGLRPGVAGREGLRRAILLREVLGLPRGLTGPHRPPASERRATRPRAPR